MTAPNLQLSIVLLTGRISEWLSPCIRRAPECGRWLRPTIGVGAAALKPLSQHRDEPPTADRRSDPPPHPEPGPNGTKSRCRPPILPPALPVAGVAPVNPHRRVRRCRPGPPPLCSAPRGPARAGPGRGGVAALIGQRASVRAQPPPRGPARPLRPAALMSGPSPRSPAWKC